MASSLADSVWQLGARLTYELAKVQPLLPTYFHLLLSAIFPIYTAAHASLARPPSADPPESGDDNAAVGKLNDEVVQKLESLSPSDAITFPLLAGITLSGLYFLLKWLQDPAFLNWCLDLYFSSTGLVFSAKFLKDALTLWRSFLFPRQYSAHGLLWKIDADKERYQAYLSPTKKAVFREQSPLPGVLRKLPIPKMISKFFWRLRRASYARATLKLHIHKILDFKTPIDNLDVMSIFIAISVAAYNAFISKPWFLTNFLGFSFCYGSLQLLTPTTAWTGTLILATLFLYDIYFVFYTPIMVTVATKLDIPIKLLFPRPDGCVLPIGAGEDSEAMRLYKECLAKKRTMAMLGLGDIVIPGMILAFALRFDLYLYYLYQRKAAANGESGRNSTKNRKPKYLQVTGEWGERFWTISKLYGPELRAKSFPTTYFTATSIGYLAGMITTLVAMQVTNRAQPALLYLVPGVLLSIWGTALFKGQVRLLWEYTEAEGDDAAKKIEEDGGRESEIDKPNGLISQGDLGDPTTKRNEPNNADLDGPAEINGKTRSISIARATESGQDKAVGEPSPKSPDMKKEDRHLFLFSISLPISESRKTAESAKRNENPGDKIHGNENQPKLSAGRKDNEGDKIDTSATMTEKNQDEKEDDITTLPDVAAENAVLAKLEREVTASSTGVVDESGGEPPEKRRRMD